MVCKLYVVIPPTKPHNCIDTKLGRVVDFHGQSEVSGWKEKGRSNCSIESLYLHKLTIMMTEFDMKFSRVEDALNRSVFMCFVSI